VAGVDAWKGRDGGLFAGRGFLVAGETVGELACAPGGYEELDCLLVGNQRGGQRGLLAFSQFDCAFIWFAWFVEILRRYISKQRRSSEPNVR
jgi:hypothetical protein